MAESSLSRGSAAGLSIADCFIVVTVVLLFAVPFVLALVSPFIAR
jgi:hypothetical protein